MSRRSQLPAAALLFTFAPFLWGQHASGSLQQHYNDAQSLQQAGKFSAAAEQYHAFLADALSELGMGYSIARDYKQAASLFGEALALEPGSTDLLLDSARTALILGELDEAKSMSMEVIENHSVTRDQLADAHQLLGRALLHQNQDQHARKELASAVTLQPTFANGYDLAVVCLDLDDKTCAIRIFSDMEKSFGDTPELHMAFGRAYGDSDFQPLAVSEFKRVIQENSRLPGAHYLLAAALLATGGDESKVNEAEKYLREELAISPRNSAMYAAACAALGKIAATRNNYLEAEKYLKQAILLTPQAPDAYLYLGQMYFDQHRFADAEEPLRQCIHFTVDVSRNRYQIQKAHFLLGRILMREGRQGAAQAQMQIARELANKTLLEDRSKLAGLMDTSGASDASEGAPQPAGGPSSGPATERGSTSAVIAGDPAALRNVQAMRKQLSGAIADSFNNLGAIAATNKDYSGAVTCFEHAATWNPSLEGLDYNWGRAAFAASRFVDAVAPLSRYLQSQPDDNGARNALSISQFMTGDYRGCVQTLKPAARKASLAPQVEYVYAESMIRTGQRASGMERLGAFEKTHPEIPDVHRAMGEALESKGEQQAAIAELRTATRLNPGDAESHHDLGKLYLETGDIAEAIPELEAAVRRSPESENFHRELAEAYSAAHRPSDARKEMAAYRLLQTRAQAATSTRVAASSAP